LATAVTARDDIERVRDATDLVALIGEHVQLQPRGREHVGLCPFHDDRRPSFAVVTHKAAAFYKCHACGAAGDCFRFVQEYLGKDFGEALRFLAERAGVELQGRDDPDQDQRRSRRAWLRRACDAAQQHFTDNLASDSIGADAAALITARGISEEMVERFGIGAAGDGWSTLKDSIEGENLPAKVLVAAGLLKQRDDGHTWDTFRHRVIFPICDETGRPIAFGGRVLGDDEEPKYLNSSEHDLFHKGRTLYGLHLARRAIMDTGMAIVAEGYTDVIACHQAGIEQVVATLGTAMTPDHARVLARLCDTCVLLFDGDEAGQRAATRAIPLMMAHDVDVKICVLPNGADPDSLLREADGPNRFRTAVDASMDAMAFLIDRLEANLDSHTSLSGRQRAIETFIQSLASQGLTQATPLRRAMLTSRLAELAGVAPAVIASLLEQAAGRQRSQAPDDPPLEPEVDLLEDPNTPISQALSRAECDVLAVAIFTTSSEFSGPFETPLVDRVTHTIRRLGTDGQRVEVPQLLEALEHEADRTRVSDLYFDGQRLVEAAAGDETVARTRAEEALSRCRREAESRKRMIDWKTSAARDPQAAAAMIEHLRGVGPRASAMPRPNTR